MRSFVIGGIAIDPPLLLAPMAGQTNHPFRRLCRLLGGVGLVCTELVSSNALEQKGSRERTLELFDWSPQESPVAVQLFGADPEVMAQAAVMVEERGADLVDINMGCWVPKVAKKGGGAALLRDLDRAVEVVRAVRQAVAIPVTVKVRAGWEEGQVTAIDFAQAAEEVGADAVAVHARFARQGFTGTADWSIIAEVRRAVKAIPVIGNGDVESAADARAMFEQTGCQGIMVGRAALGRPWYFAHLWQALQSGRQPEPPSRGQRAEWALRHAELTLETTLKPHPVAVREMRGQLCRYRLDLPGETRIRDALVRVDTLADIRGILEPLIDG